jgi:hypothetical protein
MRGRSRWWDVVVPFKVISNRNNARAARMGTCGLRMMVGEWCGLWNVVFMVRIESVIQFLVGVRRR